jgi:hypothetical protein
MAGTHDDAVLMVELAKWGDGRVDGREDFADDS